MPYSYAIINFCTDRSPFALAYRLSAKHPSSITYCEDYKSSKKIPNIGPPTKIYIVVHGDGTDFLRSESSFSKSTQIKTWHYKEFCKILLELFADLRIKPEDFNPDSPRATISLLICFAGMKSLAEKIHYELAENGLFVNIHARRSAVFISKTSGKKTTSQLASNGRILLYSDKYHHSKDKESKQDCLQVLGKILLKNAHQQPGSKLAITWEKNASDETVQAVHDSYLLKKFQKDEITKKPDYLKKTRYKDLDKNFHPEEKILELTEEEDIEKFILKLAGDINFLEEKINQSTSSILDFFSGEKNSFLKEQDYLIRLSQALENREPPPTDYSIGSAKLYYQALHLLSSATKLTK